MRLEGCGVESATECGHGSRRASQAARAPHHEVAVFGMSDREGEVKRGVGVLYGLPLAPPARAAMVAAVCMWPSQRLANGVSMPN